MKTATSGLVLLATTLLLAACSSNGAVVQMPDASRDDSGLDGRASAPESGDAGSDAAAEREGGTGDAQPSDAGAPGAPVVIGQSLSGSMVGAASSDGSAMLVVAASGPTFWWSHFEPASGWSSPVELGIPAFAQGFLQPQLAMDANGDAFLAWAYDAGADGAPAVLAAVTRYDHPTGAWGPVENPMPSAVTSNALSLAVNAKGEALVLPFTPSGGGLFAAHFAGGQWSSESVDPSDSLAYVSSLSFADDGLAAVGLGNVVTRSADGVWTVQQPTCLASVSQLLPLAIDASGDLLAPFVWEDIAMHYYLGACHYDAASATWSSVMPTGAGYVVFGPTGPTAVSSGGDGVVFEEQEAFPYTESTGTLGAGSGPQGIAPTATPSPMLALASSGAGLAVYGVSVNGVSGLQAVGYTIGSGWGAPSPAFGDAAATQMLPFVSPNGNAWVAWTDGTSTFVKKVL
jgi:hypothetical protein